LELVVSSLAVTALLLLVSRLEEQATDPVAVAEVTAELRSAIQAAQRDPIQRLGLPLELELERVVSMRTAAILRDVSIDSIARHFAQYIVRTGDKVRGIKLKYVLGLASEDVPQLPSPRRKKTPLTGPRKRRLGQGASKKEAHTSP
jgi:hypothetical protein